MKIPNNPYIEEEQKTQWPKEKGQKDKQRSTKHTHKTKDRVTRTLLKIGEISRYLDNKQQVDMLILDFSKAFDTVPHTRLLRKLDHCGVRGNIHGWLESWLTTRERKVLVDGEKSRSVKVKSGVPQGTVLEPLILTIY